MLCWCSFCWLSLYIYSVHCGRILSRILQKSDGHAMFWSSENHVWGTLSAPAWREWAEVQKAVFVADLLAHIWIHSLLNMMHISYQLDHDSTNINYFSCHQIEYYRHKWFHLNMLRLQNGCISLVSVNYDIYCATQYLHLKVVTKTVYRHCSAVWQRRQAVCV